MWRVDQDESNMSNAEKIAWEHVLPYKHIPILDSDRKEVKALAKMLDKIFSKQALSAAVKRLENQ